MNLDFGSSHSKLTIENFFAGGGFGGNTKKRERDNPDWISLRNIQKVNLNVLIQIIAPIIERRAVDHLVLGQNPPELTLMDTGGHWWTPDTFHWSPHSHKVLLCTELVRLIHSRLWLIIKSPGGWHSCKNDTSSLFCVLTRCTGEEEQVFQCPSLGVPASILWSKNEVQSCSV